MPLVSEKEFQRTVIEYAQALNFKVYHQLDTGKCKKCGEPNYSKRVGPGFVDLVIAGHGKLIFAELKSENGSLSDNQRKWAEVLVSTGARVYLWKPSDWSQIEEVLKPWPTGSVT